jgi:hypothetical protein
VYTAACAEPQRTSGVDPESDSPLVCVFGWGGAKRKHIRKLLEFYRSDLGLDTVSHIMPLKSNETQRERYVSAVGEAIKEHAAAGATADGQAERRIVFHIFSNNGTWTYARLLRQQMQGGGAAVPAMAADGEGEGEGQGEGQGQGGGAGGAKAAGGAGGFAHRHVRIFDSAPGLWTEPLPLLYNAQLFSRAIMPSLLGRLQHEHAVLTPLLVPVLVGYLAWGRATGAENSLAVNRFLFDEVAADVPSCYIYSTGDELVRADEVQGFIRYQAGRAAQEASVSGACGAGGVGGAGGGAATQLVLGDEVPHVAGFLREPEAYKEVLRGFLSGTGMLLPRREQL